LYARSISFVVQGETSLAAVSRFSISTCISEQRVAVGRVRIVRTNFNRYTTWERDVGGSNRYQTIVVGDLAIRRRVAQETKLITCTSGGKR